MLKIGGRARFRDAFGTGRTGNSRTAQRIASNLGIVAGDRANKSQLFRNDKLDLFDKYLCGTQYEHLMDWEVASAQEDFVPVRKRRPRVNFLLAKLIVDRVTSKLVGSNVFPSFKIEGDPDAEDFSRVVMTAASLKAYAPHFIRKLLGSGSTFVRFFVVGPKLMLEVYNAKYCYPVFDDQDELTELEVKYVYSDTDDLDEQGEPVKKWYKMVLGREVDTLYSNPEYVPGGSDPLFEETATAEHGLGFVQGQWFRTTKDKHTPDGESLLAGIMPFIDSINYSLSQSDQAVSYGQEPQLAVKGMDVDEIGELIKSSNRAWNLGRDGTASFVEPGFDGITRASELRDKMQHSVGEISRVVMLDPEKIVGSAQSAKAMEVLHGPLVDLVNELRPMVEEGLTALLTKMMVTVLMLDRQGVNEVISIPKGYVPGSLTLTVMWPPIFPMTMADLLQKVSVGVQASNASLFSRATITAWLAKDFGVEDVEEEALKVDNQKVLNPFGAF